MLVRQLPIDIPRLWPFCKRPILDALLHAPAKNPERMTQLMKSLMDDKGQLWLAMTDPPQEPRAIGVVITYVNEDVLSGFRNLEIYALGIIRNELSQNSVWEAGRKTLQAFARASNCDRVIGFSSVPRIIELAEAARADTSMRFITLSVEEERMAIDAPDNDTAKLFA